MEISVAGQALEFVTAAAVGALMCAVYGVMRAVRSVFPARGCITGALDGAFWFAAAVLSAVVMLTIGGGHLRGYMLAGAAMGAALYALTVGVFVTRVLAAAAKRLRGAVREAKRSVRGRIGKIKCKFRKKDSNVEEEKYNQEEARERIC